MLTCEQCGKINGHGEVGTSWICGDCKMGEQEPANDSISKKARNKSAEQGATNGQIENK
ncbi:hypothetical protein [Paenibacillus cremeus]|uniref:hypothetical protein n=1 Tax=Paenibacillus cremeus TaxID=2163881 RepID=UPI0016471655|nr:hypothetical protein [Paenibacillus cremeus]